jgi:hypothetical protein
MIIVWGWRETSTTTVQSQMTYLITYYCVKKPFSVTGESLARGVRTSDKEKLIEISCDGKLQILFK